MCAPAEGWQAAYKLLYPAYATYIGGNIGQYLTIPWNYAVQVGAVIPAHIVGRIKAAGVPDTVPPQEPAVPVTAVSGYPR